MHELPADTQQALTALCRRRQVARLVALDGLAPSTPVVQLAVEFLPRIGFGAYLMARFEQELSELLGRPVDLCAASELSGTTPGRVLSAARLLFEC